MARNVCLLALDFGDVLILTDDEVAKVVEVVNEWR